jgi:hypothetical protein
LCIAVCSVNESQIVIIGRGVEHGAARVLIETKGKERKGKKRTTTRNEKRGEEER